MKRIDIFQDGKDLGYIEAYRCSKWWFEPSYKDSFDIFDLDGFYEANYFKNDHVGQGAIKNYVKHVRDYYTRLTSKPLTSVLEAGCAGGWFTKEFLDQGIDIIALEGSECGVQATIKRGVSESRVIKHDLRRDINLNRKFDIVCCTEVAEHIEPPFSSQLIKTLTDLSDIVWFSFEAPETNGAHYHHCNEQPEKFWVNIFDFYNFNSYKLSHEIYTECEARATHVFYNRNSGEIINKL